MRHWFASDGKPISLSDSQYEFLLFAKDKMEGMLVEFFKLCSDVFITEMPSLQTVVEVRNNESKV